jgi:hypothetical protein
MHKSNLSEHKCPLVANEGDNEKKGRRKVSTRAPANDQCSEHKCMCTQLKMSGLMGRGREGKVIGNSAGATKMAVMCNKSESFHHQFKEG